MRCIDILSLPSTKMAHAFKAHSYDFVLPVIPDHIEIAYVADGKLTAEIDGFPYTASKGDVLCLLNDRSTHVHSESDHCHHTVGFSVKWKDADNRGGLLLPYVTPSSEGTDRICSMIDECIYRQFDTAGPTAADPLRLLGILCGIDRISRKAERPDTPGEALAAKAVKYINLNMAKPLTQSDIAGYLGISPGYLCSIFKKSKGVTVMNYINTIKLKGVRSLMESSGMKLYEAAFQYGYSDPNCVSKLYKKMFGRNITENPAGPGV